MIIYKIINQMRKIVNPFLRNKKPRHKARHSTMINEVPSRANILGLSRIIPGRACDCLFPLIRTKFSNVVTPVDASPRLRSSTTDAGLYRLRG